MENGILAAHLTLVDRCLPRAIAEIRRPMTRRMFFLALDLIFVGLFMTGCGNVATPAPTATISAPASTSTPSATPTPSATRSPLPSSTPSRTAPVFVYPVNSQVLDYEGSYLFKVEPKANAEGFLWGFFPEWGYGMGEPTR